MTSSNKGLEGFVVAQSRLGSIDGKGGRLRYNGYDIHDLVKGSWEEVVYLLWHDRLPNQDELRRFNEQLVAARTLTDAGGQPLLDEAGEEIVAEVGYVAARVDLRRQ